MSKSCGKNPLIGGTLPSINCCSGLRLPHSSQDKGLVVFDLPPSHSLFGFLASFWPPFLPCFLPSFPLFFLFASSCWGMLGKLGGDTSVSANYSDWHDSGLACCNTAAVYLPSLTLCLGSEVRHHTLPWCTSYLPLPGCQSSCPDAALPFFYFLLLTYLALTTPTFKT